jgi:D-alanine-D-alanine ligase
VKVAVVYNRDSRNVINLFGTPNREKIGLKTIRRITDALRRGGHQVIALEADKDLIDRLEHFMPRILAGEQPGMVFNVSYGIQGEARYTHVPSILEMMGVPYVASGPLAHSLALDKVVTKMILRQSGLPTPDFAVLATPNDPLPDLAFPLIVKPKNEAVSFGLRIVRNEEELREGAAAIWERFHQPVLVERYVEGREINVGLLGNAPPEVLPPVELIFDESGDPIYTYADKTGQSGRTISHRCPPDLPETTLDRARDVARRAFEVLGCRDCARVDMRLDGEGDLHLLEVNSLPSLGEHGSYLVGAAKVGLDFGAVINRLVDVASARYFGTPQPPAIDGTGSDLATEAFAYIARSRDRMERRLRDWVNLTSHTVDPAGIQEAAKRIGRLCGELGMVPIEDLTDGRTSFAWDTRAGLEDGTLFVAQLDVPVDADVTHHRFRREPEWLYGDGIGTSRSPLAVLGQVLRTLRHVRRLRKTPLGLLLYADEGRHAVDSAETIRVAAARAGRVIVLRPGGKRGEIFLQRRGQRRYRLRAEAPAARPGSASKRPELMRWVMARLEEFAQLGSPKERLSVSTLEIRAERMPLLLPHRVTAQVLLTYPGTKQADELEQRMLACLPKGGPRCELKMTSDRPPLRENRKSTELRRALDRVAKRWDIPLRTETSVWPSVAGLVPDDTPCVCGLGPAARDLSTPTEAVERLSLVQRALLLTQFLLETTP